ncbi:uncharacterized protein [Watersipora subatra]|uniref:uncharacterized protein n=1 Tax=Watersipora subatra TaxID=2589382 RepID=UPI00355BE8BE
MMLRFALLSLLLAFANCQGPSINCNLQNGVGCSTLSPYFYFTYQFTHPGIFSECRNAYNLIVYVTAPYDGFECSFVTDGNPQPNTQRYTISHSSNPFWAPGTAYVDAYGSDVYVEPEDSSNARYVNNWWYIPKAHAPYGYSFVNYRFETRRLEFYSNNTGVHYQMGHPKGFKPVGQYTYIGLNKVYDHNSYGGYGLCQVYCQLVTQPPQAAASDSGGSTRGATPTIPTPPSPPPSAPTVTAQDSSA